MKNTNDSLNYYYFNLEIDHKMKFETNFKENIHRSNLEIKLDSLYL